MFRFKPVAPTDSIERDDVCLPELVDYHTGVSKALRL